MTLPCERQFSKNPAVYSGEAVRAFRSNPSVDSGAKRPLIPQHVVHESERSDAGWFVSVLRTLDSRMSEPARSRINGLGGPGAGLSPPGIGSRAVLGHRCAAQFSSVLLAVCWVRRMDAPFRLMRWAWWTSRSRMASANVVSPTTACQWSKGSWLVIRVARRL